MNNHNVAIGPIIIAPENHISAAVFNCYRTASEIKLGHGFGIVLPEALLQE